MLSILTSLKFFCLVKSLCHFNSFDQIMAVIDTSMCPDFFTSVMTLLLSCASQVKGKKSPERDSATIRHRTCNLQLTSHLG